MNKNTLKTTLKSKFPEITETNEGWLNINCPFCVKRGFSVDKKRHLGINCGKEFVTCFKCHYSADLYFFFRDLNIRCEFISNKRSINTKKEEKKEITPIYELPDNINIKDLNKYPNKNCIDAIKYIESRIGLLLAEELKIGFIPTGKYANRILIPIFKEGVLVYYVARAIYSFLQPKILNSPAKKEGVLFNYDIAKNFNEIFIMEGVFSALTIYPYGIALLGKVISEYNILAIIRVPNIIYINICLDGGTQREAKVIANKMLSLTSRIKIKILDLEKDKQPDDYTLSALMKKRNETNFYVKEWF